NGEHFFKTDVPLPLFTQIRKY
ncbi:unnamed protein product, partial [Allacma fusca]